MSFTHVNTDVYRNATSGQGSWTINAGTVGDLRIVGTVTHSTGINVSSISGGGVTTWTRAGSVFTTASGRNEEIWYGVITSTGTALTFNFSASIGSTQFRSNVQDFRPSGGGTTFTVQDTGTASNASSATYTFPSMDSINAGELYFAHGHVGDSASAGSTPGFTYTIDANGNPRCYNGNLAAATNYAPTGPHTASTSYFIGAIFAEAVTDTEADAEAAVSPAATVNQPVSSLRITPRQIGV